MNTELGTEVEEFDKIPVETLPIWKKRRYIIAFLAFFGFINVYTLRINLSVGIVAMTENRTIEHEDGSKTYEQYFNWSSQQQGLILSSFFYGYIATQILSGYLAARFGGSILLGLGILSTSICTLFSPLAAHAGVGAFVTLRVIMGLAEAVTYPCMHAMWSKWAPPLERSRLGSVSHAGGFAGMVISLSTCGILAEKLGWESVFYVFGIIGCVWWVFWAWFVRESPDSDGRVSEEERRYIKACLKQSKDVKPAKVPWKSIFTSGPVLAIAVAHFAENWGNYTMLTQLPLFMKHNLNFDLANSGYISAIPYMGLGFLLIFVSYSADWIQKRGFLTTSQVRKFYNCLAFVSQTTFMMLAAYQRNRVLIIVFITFGAALGALSICGYGVNHLDIAPQFASILFGISNTAATIPGIVSPLIAGFIVTEQDNPNQWRWIFIITSCVYCFGCLVYWFFSSGELQPWAKIEPDENYEEKVEKVEKEEKK